MDNLIIKVLEVEGVTSFEIKGRESAGFLLRETKDRDNAMYLITEALGRFGIKKPSQIGAVNLFRNLL